MQDIKPTYLVMVTSSNNNKYYRMIPNGSTFTVEYGRIGSSKQVRSYSISQWNKKYNEKISKGYVDQTDLMMDLCVKQNPYKEIENKHIASIVEYLQSIARQKISDNYTISSNNVTKAMVDNAQEIINSLITIKNVNEFNDTLLKLFAVIPRKMGNVASYLSASESDFANIIKDEQDLLDVMKGQIISAPQDPDPNDKKEVTVLEANGIVFDDVSNEDILKIKSLLGSCADKFYDAWKVKNISTEEKFNEFIHNNKITNNKLLWHGSRNENWWSIVNTGLVLRPTNAVITGKMFGYGIYFATKARKSLGYTSLSGSYWAHGGSNRAFMALYEVAYGKPYDVYSFDSAYYNMNYDNLQKVLPGANCLHAHEGKMLKNDEIIVYKEQQITIRYLVELR